MAVGDRVRVGFGTIDISKDNVPIYQLETYQHNNQIMVDPMGAATPKVVGAVKGGSYGLIVGGPIKVIKSLLRGMSAGAAAMGLEHVLMFPVEFEYYKQVAWVPQDHMHVVSGKIT